MLRRLLLLGLAACDIAQAAPQPRLDLAVAPVWKGWSRPGRTTELDIRLSTDAATRATLTLVAGHQSLKVDIDLEPGRALRLHVPVASVEAVAVSVASAGATLQRLDVGIAQSESPMLGLGLVTADQVKLEGFHVVALAADDLPRNGSAYSSVDALILDAPTLGALDQRQLGALLAHAVGCGRIVVLNAAPEVRRLLDGAGACGGQALMSAASLAEARDMLESSLAVALPQPMSFGGIGELARPSDLVWHLVSVAVALYFIAAAVALMFFAAWPALLVPPALAALAALVLPHAMSTPSQVVVWSEGESGARLARYQALQRFPGVVRERKRVAIPSLLASSAQPCDPTQGMQFDFDTSRDSVTFAEFETRLFRQVWLCYSGTFPMARAIAIDARQGGVRDVRNAGTKAWWAPGLLLASGQVHELPALGPGASTKVGTGSSLPHRDALLRTALTRTRPDGVAGLWPLSLDGVSGVSVDGKGWLLVNLPP